MGEACQDAIGVYYVLLLLFLKLPAIAAGFEGEFESFQLPEVDGTIFSKWVT